MQEIFNFLLQYWRPILGAILVLVSFLLALVRKKPVNNIVALIYEYAFDAVCDVEDSSVIGPTQKLECAVEIVKKMLKAHYPDLKVDSYIAFIVTAIEQFLKAPQATKYKKEEK